MATERLETILSMQYAQYTAAVDTVMRQTAQLEQTVNKRFLEMQDSARRGLQGIRQGLVGLNLDQVADRLASGARAGAAALGQIIQPAAIFETQLRRVNQIAKLNDDQLEALGVSIRQINKDLGAGVKPAEATAAAYEIMGSGFTNVADAQKVLRSAILGAQAGFEDTDKLAKLLTGSLNAYGAGADQAARFTDILFEGVNAGTQTIPQLVQSLGLVTGIASSAGVSFEELNAAVSTLTVSGLQTSSAVEGLRGLLNGLVKPTKEATDEQERLGITINAQTLKQDGLLKTIQKISVATNGNTEAMAKLVGGSEALGVALKLTDGNGAKFAATLEQITKANGSAAKAYEQTAKSYEQQKKVFLASLDDLAVGVGTKVLPFLTSLTQAGNAVIGVLDRIPTPVKVGALALAGLATAGAGLLAGIATVAATAPAVLSFFVTFGTAALPHAAKALSVFNFLLTTNVSGWTLQAERTAIAAAAQRGYAAAAATSSGSLAALNGALGVSIGRLALMATGWGAVAAAIIYAAKKFADWQTQQAEDAARAASAAGGIGLERNRKTDASTGQILAAGGVDNLKKKGIDLEDVSFRIAQLRSKVRDLYTEAREGGKSVDQAAVNRIEATIARLVQVQKALNDDQGKPKEEATVLQAPTGKTKLEDKKEREEALRDEIQRIKISEEGTQKRIADLKQLLALPEAEGALRRQILNTIHSLEIQHKREVAEREKKNAQDKLKNEIVSIETSKQGEAAKIAALQRLAKAHKDDGELQRDIAQKVFDLKEKLSQKEEQNLKKLSDLRKESLQLELDKGAEKESELDRARSRGADVSAQQAEQIRAAAKKQKEIIDEELKGKLADKDLSPEAAAKEKDLARQRKDAEDRKASRALRDLGQQAAEDQVTREQVILGSEKSIADRKLALILQQAAAGRASENQLKAAVLERLAVQEREIQQELLLAKLRTDSPAAAAAAEAEANGKIMDARRAAREELERGTEALRAQKAERDRQKAEEGGGKILSLDQVAQQLSGSFGIDAVRKRQDEIRKANAGAFNQGASGAIAGIPQLDTRQLERQVQESRPTSVAKLEGTVGIEVRIKDERGRDLPAEVSPTVTTDGRNSSVQFATRRMDGRRCF